MIRVDTNMEELIAALAERRTAGEQPVLFLGEGIAQAAGMPTIEEMARDLYPTITPYLKHGAIDEDPLHGFYDFWQGLEPFDRQSLLQRYYGEKPVPAFYFDLVKLLAGDCFAYVATTSFDTLLEQALDLRGLRRGQDYLVATPDDLSALDRLSPDWSPLIVVKLRGDLAGGELAILPDEVERRLAPQRRAVKGGLLSGEIVMVCYGFEIDMINKWLASTQGALWWVSQEQPEPGVWRQIRAAHRTRLIDGPNAHPQEFFGILSMALATPDGAQAEPSGSWTTVPSSDAAPQMPSPDPIEGEEPVPTPAVTEPGDIEPQWLEEQLKQHLRRKQDLDSKMLYQSTVDPALQTQIAYEQEQIRRIVERLATLRGGPAAQK